LNYFDPEGPIATIAMTRIPALVASDSAEYRGPILFNPGGPGGSGVDMIATAGRHFQSVVGPHFDILGFDPRGVCLLELRFEGDYLSLVYCVIRCWAFYARI